MLVSSAHRPRRTRALASVFAFGVVVGACGTGSNVPVPGVAEPPTSLAASSDAAVFVEASPDPSNTDVDGRVELATPAPARGESPDPALLPADDSETAATEEDGDTAAAGSAVPSQREQVVMAPVVPVVSGWAAFDQHLMTILADGSSAVSASVLRNGEVIHEVALGQRTSRGEPVATGDRFRVASISKMITAISVLRLVQAGLVGLDEVVGPRLAARVRLSAPSGGVEAITVRHLLTHRSGIGQYENLMFRRQVESCAAAGASGLSRGLERAPGTTYRYSNLNFCLLGLLIEDVTGETYEAVVDRELLEPLGIDGMRLAGTFDVGDGDVEHESDAGRNYMEVLDGAGSWIASPTDIARIVNSLDLATPGWKPLGPVAHAEMMTITIDPPEPPAPAEPVTDTATTVVPPLPLPAPAPAPPPTRGYGMGLMIFGEGAFGHTGTLESTSAMTVRQPNGITWAITVSGDSPGSGRDLAPIMAEAFRYAGDV